MEREALNGILHQQRARRVRWLWTGASGAITVAIVSMAWYNRVRVAEAVHALNESVGVDLLSAVRAQLRMAVVPPSGVSLDSLLTMQGRAGLRGIAFFDSDGHLIARAGDHADQHGAHMRPRDIEPDFETTPDGRMRMATEFRRTIDSTGVGLRWATLTGAPEDTAHPSLIVVDYDPTLADSLLDDADEILTLATLAGAALLVVTAVAWRMATQLERTRQRTDQELRLAMLGEMSAVLAHEIRNPLSSLKGHAQLLQRRLPPQSAESVKAQLVVAEAERIERLTNELLEFSRSGPLSLAPTDPVALIQTCIADARLEGITVAGDRAPRSWTLDARRVQRAIANLLQNAHQHSPPDRSPTVSVRVDSGALVIAVRDFGDGFSATDAERMFTPFFTTRTVGTGLGLAVAQRIAEAHGGKIVAASLQDGALFELHLPSKERDARARELSSRHVHATTA